MAVQEIVLGVGVFVAALLYVAFKLEERHQALRVILIFVSFLTLIQIPQALINSSSLIDTHLRLLKTMTWTFRIFYIYCALYIVYNLMKNTSFFPEWLKVPK